MITLITPDANPLGLDMSRGEVTTVSRATPKGKLGSLRTVIPKGIVKHLDLKPGDQLDWSLTILEGELAVVVRKVS
jgi:bifunctional DNA-binding transcriptional regulator/antitoxin component of YhaV-PrlF toxin-antitoxin module